MDHHGAGMDHHGDDVVSSTVSAALAAATTALANVTSAAVSSEAQSAEAGHSHDGGHGMMMMKPFLHFTGGDPILFESIVPNNAGTIFAACVFTFFLAMFNRYVAALARGLNHKCALRARNTIQQIKGLESGDQQYPHSPFILSLEMSRSGVVGLDIILHYTLMLIAMTFQAAYIISLILGTMVGEFVFGRLHRYTA